jgi:hypothetical protein
VTVHRRGVDTLHICDYSGNNRVVKVTAGGEFMRDIALPEYSLQFGVRYCGVRWRHRRVTFRCSRCDTAGPSDQVLQDTVTGNCGIQRVVSFTADGRRVGQIGLKSGWWYSSFRM